MEGLLYEAGPRNDEEAVQKAVLFEVGHELGSAVEGLLYEVGHEDLLHHGQEEE